MFAKIVWKEGSVLQGRGLSNIIEVLSSVKNQKMRLKLKSANIRLVLYLNLMKGFSSSFSVGLMRVPAVISKVPTLRPCQPFRARSFPPVLAGQTSACFRYACVTGRDSGGLRKAPTSPASGYYLSTLRIKDPL